jgi:SAM-dependent methyltransferase
VESNEDAGIDTMTITTERQPRLYTDLAVWWPLFSPPSEYLEEAADLLPALLGAPDTPPATLLELGSGGGSLAYHLKERLALTLSDRSADMLAVSRKVNPECAHVLGDMRTVDLAREFDLVLIHDAIMYATDSASVRASLATAYRHCRPGGAALIVPDCVRETFHGGTSTGGTDGTDGRALRYLEWTWDPDRHDETFEVALAFLLCANPAAQYVAIAIDIAVACSHARPGWRGSRRRVLRRACEWIPGGGTCLRARRRDGQGDEALSPSFGPVG